MENILGFLSINIFALILGIMLSIVFFSKKRLHQAEDRIYSFFLIANVVSTFFGILLGVVLNNFKITGFISIILQKSYLLGLIIWGSLLTYYAVYVCYIKRKNNDNLHKRFRKISCFFIMFVEILMLILPISHEFTSTGSIVNGPAIIFAYSFFAIMMLLDFFAIFSAKGNILNKKLVPIYSLVICGGFVFTIQMFFPTLNYLLNPCMVLITFIMYFTIENPDVKMIEQLNVAKDQAERANSAKSDFLSSMSHEIRTPLNAIVGFSECILKADDITEAKDNANDVIIASKTLLDIVNSILDISKIESGKLELVEVDYDSRRMFNEIVKLAQGRIGDKALEFNVDIAQDLPSVLYGDHFNLKKIIINLLTNAIKYTDEGYVNFSVKCLNQNDLCKMIITVKDSGRGIKKEDIDKLFTKFQRLDEDRNTTLEGTGLGLAITKQLIEMMNGKIVVNSIYGEGSEFSVVLAQKISDKVIVNKDTNEIVNIDLSDCNVLVVDDNKLNLKVATKFLEDYKCNVITASNGFECIDMVKSGKKIDLILIDDMMPKMKGSEVLSELKNIDGFKCVIVALTANAINGMREKYLSLGFDDYLSKPIDKFELNRVLKEHLDHDQIVEMPIVKEDYHADIGCDYSGKRVLIVDDNKLNIKIAIKMLNLYNFTIDECLSGFEALNKVKDNKYDLIFMDYMMPDMDGIETLEKLKVNPGFDIPVIALTADAVVGAKEKFINKGFNGYVSKPINKKLLDVEIKKCLGEKK